MNDDKRYLLVKLQKHTTINPVTNCWLWTGSLSKGGKSAGYGRVNILGTVHYVHRVSAHIFHDLTLEKNIESQVLHKCDMKECWNPDHLYVGTHADNMTDRDGFTLSGKTECKNGHDVSTPDKYYEHKNQRKCKQCMKDDYEASRGR